MTEECADSSEEEKEDISEDLFDDSEEVSLLELDPDKLAEAMDEAGISIKVDPEGSGVDVQVLSDDVSTFLVLAPEEEFIGARFQGFIPREDGGLSALEMHGQLVDGDILTHLNGSDARLIEFSDILKACRSPDRGGLPRPLVMRFSRPEALSVPTFPVPASSAAATGKTEVGDRGSAGEGNGSKTDVVSGGGGSSLLEELMGGLSLPGFAAAPAEASQPAGGERESKTMRDGVERHRKIPGMAQIKDVFRVELQAQGMLGGRGDARNGSGDAAVNGSDGTFKSENASPPPPVGGESLFMNVLRRLESIEVLGEETPGAVAPAVARGVGATESLGGYGSDPGGNRAEGRREEDPFASRGNDREDHVPSPLAMPGTAGTVGSSLAGVGAKLRSRFRKPGGFGLTGQSTPSAGGGDGDSGKAFVEGATKALAINRERMMGWMKDFRPKDWSPRAANRQVEHEVLQELRRAVRCLYLDAPETPVHTSMVVARARPSGGGSDKGGAGGGGGGDRVIGTGADKNLVKLVWFRSSAGGGFAEIKGVDGPYYQLSANDVGSRICIKCTLDEAALSTPGAGVSPSRRRGPDAVQAPSPTRLQTQVAFAEVGPIILDPSVGEEVDALVAQEPAVFEGLVRRDVPGESHRVRVEVEREKVRVLREPCSIPAAKTGAVEPDSAAKTGRDGKPVVLAEGLYSSGVLVSLDPTRPAALKLTIFLEGRKHDDGGGDDNAVFSLGAADGRRRDLLALTLRRRRQAALGPDVVVDDTPEETEVQQFEENYLELKAAAAHFAKAFDEDDVMEEEDDDDDEDYDDEEEGESDSEYSCSLYSSEDGDIDGETTNGERTKAYRIGPAVVGESSTVASGGEPREGRVGLITREGDLSCASWETREREGEGHGARSLSDVLEDLREARAVAEARGRQLVESHAAWETADAGRERAEAELRLVSSELDLLRPLSRSLAARAEGKSAAEEKAATLEAKVSCLEKRLGEACQEAEGLRSRVSEAEDEAGATAGKLSGMEKVVRRLGEEAEGANNNLAMERAAKEDAVSRASKAERELDLARARAAVLENKLAILEKEMLELQVEANAFKARAEAVEEKFHSARAAEVENLTSRVTELEAEVSTLDGAKNDAVARMESALASQAAAEARAKEAIAAEEETRARMADKMEQVMQLTAQRNSAKNRADSLAKDLSRVCGGGRSVDQIEAIVTRYADLKVQMAAMKAEKDGAIVDLHDQWPPGFDATGKGTPKGMAEAARRAMRQNTELSNRLEAMTETLHMRAEQLEGQRQSNAFLLERVEELERQVATSSGFPPVGTD